MTLTGYFVKDTWQKCEEVRYTIFWKQKNESQGIIGQAGFF